MPTTTAFQPAAAWRKRVFRNTFTRNGKRIAVKGWSIKIQHQGIRRTMALAAPTRDAAALEAQALYQSIVAQGWEAAAISNARPTGNRISSKPDHAQNQWPKTDVRHWQQRLLLRRPPVAETSPAREWTTRVEHAGMGAYFPLGTAEPLPAAQRALEIYQTIVERGWGDAFEHFAREITVAVHWAGNPLGWTYTTLHTRSSDGCFDRPSNNSKPVRRWRVALIEPEAGIRRALAEAIHRHPDCVCESALAGVEVALRDLPGRRLDLLLINQHQTNNSILESLQELSHLAPDRPIVLYSVYEDSEQLFKATPGGASGYLLKRTAPGQLLAPLSLIPQASAMRSEQIARSVRRYFQNLIESWPAEASSPDLARLTHREQQVLNLMAKGHVDKEIADALGISVWTVHGHVKNIFEKFGVHSRTEAVVKYLHK
jgi:DNA-binding NarL/FixJ family response regulator